MKVLYGEVCEWNRDVDNEDLTVVGTFDGYDDAYYFILDRLDARLCELGYEEHSATDYVGDVFCMDEYGYSQVVATVGEEDASIVDTDEWWVIVAD